MRVGVIGAGIIGLTIAWECQRRGHDVVVADPNPGQGASHVAAGMLAPVGEADFGEGALTELFVAAAREWPGFVAALGEDVGYRTEGTLQVGLTADDLAVLRRLAAHQEALGFEMENVVPQEFEPSLHPRARGMLVRADRQVDPRLVLRALSRRVPVVEALPEVDVTVLAAGTASANWGLPVRPVKGVLLRLRGPALLRHTLRAQCAGNPVYLVPREDGEVIVGATSEEGASTGATAGAVRDLLRPAIDLVPDLAELMLAEVCVGHRPGTPDNAPIVGPLGTGMFVATGHYRNGVLAAPLTAKAVADMIEGAPVPELWRPFTPGRFK